MNNLLKVEVGDRVRIQYDPLDQLGVVRHKFDNKDPDNGTYTQCYVELDKPLKITTEQGKLYLDHLTMWEGFCVKI